MMRHVSQRSRRNPVITRRAIAPVFILTVLIALLCATQLVFAQSSPKSRTTRTTQPQTKTPTPQTGDSFDQTIKLANDAREAGRFEEAVRHYGRALQLRPNWAEGWWYVGAILYENDRYADARDAFRNLVAIDPKRGPGWGMLGLCEFQTREYDRAVVSLQRGRGLGLGGNTELESVVRYHTSLLYIRFEQFEIAYDILSEFTRVGNQSPKVIEAFGLAMMRLAFLPPELPADRRELVMVAGKAGFYIAARRPGEARAAFDELLARFGNNSNVHYAHGVYMMNQDADAAVKEFKRELEISPYHQPSMVQLAFEYLKRDEYETALPLAEKAVQLAPNMFPARNVLGRILLEMGQIDRAIKELEAGARLAPTSPEMYFALARAYTRAGRKEDAAKARETFKRLEEQYKTERGDAKPDGSGGEPPKSKI